MENVPTHNWIPGTPGETKQVNLRKASTDAIQSDKVLPQSLSESIPTLNPNQESQEKMTKHEITPIGIPDESLDFLGLDAALRELESDPEFKAQMNKQPIEEDDKQFISKLGPNFSKRTTVKSNPPDQATTANKCSKLGTRLVTGFLKNWNSGVDRLTKGIDVFSSKVSKSKEKFLSEMEYKKLEPKINKQISDLKNINNYSKILVNDLVQNKFQLLSFKVSSKTQDEKVQQVIKNINVTLVRFALLADGRSQENMIKELVTNPHIFKAIEELSEKKVIAEDQYNMLAFLKCAYEIQNTAGIDLTKAVQKLKEYANDPQFASVADLVSKLDESGDVLPQKDGGSITSMIEEVNPIINGLLKGNISTLLIGPITDRLTNAQSNQ
jgi:hypothetical protein